MTINTAPRLGLMFHPHSACLAGNETLILHFVTSDLFIFVSYTILGLFLAWFAWRRRALFGYVWYLYGAFIFCCGFTHLMHIVTMYSANYFWMAAVVNDVTAGVSFATLLAALWMAPHINAAEAGR